MEIKQQQLDVKVQLTTLNTIEEFTLTVLVDSRYMNLCINQTFIERNKINIQKYKNPIPYYNADSSQNKAGTITEFVKVKLNI